jgi:hypothetical protein
MYLVGLIAKAPQAAASDSLPRSTYMPIRIQHDKPDSTLVSAPLGTSVSHCARKAMLPNSHN